MPFPQSDVDELLAETGRMCAICHSRPNVQIHHIVRPEEGGSDIIDNAIPLCPNCHDEVHSSYAPGRTTRVYTPGELMKHLSGTKALHRESVDRQRGSPRDEDLESLVIYSQSLDREAFRRKFQDELSFVDFDRAMEDTELVLNTGCWRTRDGTVIARTHGKSQLTNPAWRERLDLIVAGIGAIRRELRIRIGLDRAFHNLEGPISESVRGNVELEAFIDDKRRAVIVLMNEVLGEAGLPLVRSSLLTSIGEHLRTIYVHPVEDPFEGS